MKKIVIGIIIIAVVVIGIVAVTRDRQPQGPVTPTGEVGRGLGDTARDFQVKDYEGAEVKLSDFRGQPVVLNFWATWCPFCVDELPLFVTVQEGFDNSYVTLAVDRAEKLERAKSYTDDLGISDKLKFVIDDSDRIYLDYGGFSMPYTVFIDKDGVIKDIKQGPLTEAELKSKLTKILP